MRPDSKLRFDQAAEALGLDPATRDLAWRRMMDIGIAPDDPTVIYLAVGGLLEKAAGTIPEAISTLPDRVEAAAARAVGQVAEAASARVEAAHAALAETTGEAVAAVAMKHVQHAERAQDRIVGLRLGALAVAVGLACGVAGWNLGRFETARIAAQWAGLAARADGPEWLKLIAANPDLRQQMSKFCELTQLKIDPKESRAYCEVPLWIEGASAPIGGLWNAIFLELRSWLVSWGPVWLIAAGLLAGLVIRRLLSTIFVWRPVAWLLR